jgi:hypothetical protein
MKQIEDCGNGEDVEAIFCAIERAFFAAGDALAEERASEPAGRESSERAGHGQGVRDVRPAGARPALVGAALVGSVCCAVTVVLSLAT